MSVSLKSAFNMVLKLQSRTMSYLQIKTGKRFSLDVAPSNYFRNFQLPEEIVSIGREFVFSYDKFLEAGFEGSPKRGDKLTDPVLGTFTVTESREMVVMNEIIGFRVRAD